ncbi:peptide-methionine (S)-S-oxide reductase [Orenia metallireducens]|jgi:peptide-methionine (S)-S-oxide reductase|uniref:Peptide methionine sulfoxide reductase MsrA n=1 Tax=Orenia metallireducens TaxID=1413210 RepID=A0A1C0A7K9_9FIRM|nr:peptide-methionine (S)-S-oxide reductase MsrA [Orenia metallireducens]OCL26201.1 peptide-methionine (S)-S-oxide reductase [Orenia metallireducens]
MEKATFAAGCFWGVQALFDKIDGVISTTVGYIGGQTDEPTYEEVCTDQTGHAEAIEITFDPSEITYKELLELFWNNHNPTTLNRQGVDVGTQYRSAIFYHNKEQEEIAKQSKEALANSNKYQNPIVTEIVAATTFYPAEEYHQKYLQKRGQNSCGI